MGGGGLRWRGGRREGLGADGELHPLVAVSEAADEVVPLGLVELEGVAPPLAVVGDRVRCVALVVSRLVHLHHVRHPRRVVEHEPVADVEGGVLLGPLGVVDVRIPRLSVADGELRGGDGRHLPRDEHYKDNDQGRRRRSPPVFHPLLRRGTLSLSLSLCLASGSVRCPVPSSDALFALFGRPLCLPSFTPSNVSSSARCAANFADGQSNSLPVTLSSQMEKKRKRNDFSTFQSTTLREENIGRKHVSMSSILKMKHLQRLATWAGGEAVIPPLGALFGNRLAANAEAEGIPLDRSTLLCQRCESILQPGLNCTVRIEKNKARRRKKAHIPSQNNVVYTCNFCSHRNLEGGTPKGHVKGLLVARQSLSSDSKSSDKSRTNTKERSIDEFEPDQNVQCKLPPKPESISESKCSTPGKGATVQETPINKIPMTPTSKPENLLEQNRKSNGLIPRKLQISGNSSASTNSGKGNSRSSKRRRKVWTSLKEIAEINEAENSRSISNLAIPFLLTCEKK